MVNAHDAILFYRHLERRGIPAWVTGGWGVDALLGEQTRPHKDLDILVLVDDVTRMCGLLACDGYVLKEIWSENRRTVDRLGVEIDTAFVLGDTAGRDIDVHAMRLDGEGAGIPAWEAAAFVFRSHDLAGEGTIDEVAVRCVTPEMQLVCHTGYDLPDAHRRDVERLCARFDMGAGDANARAVSVTART